MLHDRLWCAACGGDLADFLDLGSSPLADSFPQDAAAKERWYPLVAAVCMKCQLAQLRAVVPDEELYGDDYGFRTGSSPAAVRYFASLAGELLGEHGREARKLTAEIACNDGTLLGNFARAGCPVLGIEPVKGAAFTAADKNGAEVITQPFSLALGQELRGRAGLVLAFNVAAHVADPVDFLKGARELLAKDGVAVIEFQDLDALIAGCQFDHVYHEHRFYYSLGSFGRLAVKCGLDITDWKRTPAQGGSLRVTLRRREGDRVTHWPPGLAEDMTQFEGMQARADYAKRRLRILVQAELNEGRVIAGWGASAKSATLLGYCRLGPRQVAWVEDVTPGKIGRFTPGTHIPVRAPGKKPDTYLLTSWNYAGSMLRAEREFLDGGGRVIVPGAVPVIL